jgi:hypothetical protein
MFNALDAGQSPQETFYDGYVVNTIIDAAYGSIASKKWEHVNLALWRGQEGDQRVAAARDVDADHVLVKEEIMPDGSTKVIVRNKRTGEISHRTR